MYIMLKILHYDVISFLLSTFHFTFTRRVKSKKNSPTYVYNSNHENQYGKIFSNFIEENQKSLSNALLDFNEMHLQFNA